MKVQRSLSTLNTMIEVPLSKAPNPKLLPGLPQHKWLPSPPGVCSLLCVYTLDGCTLAALPSREVRMEKEDKWLLAEKRDHP